MLGDFVYCNPTKLYFGKGAIRHLNDELPKYGKNVLLVYGGGSIKKNGIYDEAVKLLQENGKNVPYAAKSAGMPAMAGRQAASFISMVERLLLSVQSRSAAV